MADESNPHGTPNIPGERSWTPPPPPPSQPRAQPASPPGDSTGGTYADPERRAEATGGVARGATVTLTPGLVLGVVAVAAVVIGLFVKESDVAGAPSVNLWDRTSAPLWSIVAIAAAAATLLPALHSAVSVPARLAWTIGAVGAGYLVFWWVLFILPSISLNVAFLVTIGVAAGVAAVWTSSANPYRSRYTAS
jgi:hypothetical protein